MQNKYNKYRRLPSGKSSKSADRYVREWRSLGRKLCKALGGERYIIGYDPGFLIYYKNSYSSENYPTWLALKIVELYEMKHNK